jgi:hypothetical protein
VFHYNGNTAFRDIPAGAVDTNELLVSVEVGWPKLKPVYENLSDFFGTDRLLLHSKDC